MFEAQLKQMSQASANGGIGNMAQAFGLPSQDRAEMLNSLANYYGQPPASLPQRSPQNMLLNNMSGSLDSNLFLNGDKPKDPRLTHQSKTVLNGYSGPPPLIDPRLNRSSQNSSLSSENSSQEASNGVNTSNTLLPSIPSPDISNRTVEKSLTPRSKRVRTQSILLKGSCIESTDLTNANKSNSVNTPSKPKSSRSRGGRRRPKVSKADLPGPAPEVDNPSSFDMSSQESYMSSQASAYSSQEYSSSQDMDFSSQDSAMSFESDISSVSSQNQAPNTAFAQQALAQFKYQEPNGPGQNNAVSTAPSANPELAGILTEGQDEDPTDKPVRIKRSRKPKPLKFDHNGDPIPEPGRRRRRPKPGNKDPNGIHLPEEVSLDFVSGDPWAGDTHDNSSQDSTASQPSKGRAKRPAKVGQKKAKDPNMLLSYGTTATGAFKPKSTYGSREAALTNLDGTPVKKKPRKPKPKVKAVYPDKPEGNNKDLPEGEQPSGIDSLQFPTFQKKPTWDGPNFPGAHGYENSPFGIKPSSGIPIPVAPVQPAKPPSADENSKDSLLAPLPNSVSSNTEQNTEQNNSSPEDVTMKKGSLLEPGYKFDDNSNPIDIDDDLFPELSKPPHLSKQVAKATPDGDQDTALGGEIVSPSETAPDHFLSQGASRNNSDAGPYHSEDSITKPGEGFVRTVDSGDAVNDNEINKTNGSSMMHGDGNKNQAFINTLDFSNSSAPLSSTFSGGNPSQNNAIDDASSEPGFSLLCPREDSAVQPLSLASNLTFNRDSQHDKKTMSDDSITKTPDSIDVTKSLVNNQLQLENTFDANLSAQSQISDNGGNNQTNPFSANSLAQSQLNKKNNDPQPEDVSSFNANPLINTSEQQSNTSQKEPSGDSLPNVFPSGDVEMQSINTASYDAGRFSNHLSTLDQAKLKSNSSKTGADTENSGKINITATPEIKTEVSSLDSGNLSQSSQSTDPISINSSQTKTEEDENYGSLESWSASGGGSMETSAPVQPPAPESTPATVDQPLPVDMATPTPIEDSGKAKKSGGAGIKKAAGKGSGVDKGSKKKPSTDKGGSKTASGGPPKEKSNPPKERGAKEVDGSDDNDSCFGSEISYEEDSDDFIDQDVDDVDDIEGDTQYENVPPKSNTYLKLRERLCQSIDDCIDPDNFCPLPMGKEETISVIIDKGKPNERIIHWTTRRPPPSNRPALKDTPRVQPGVKMEYRHATEMYDAWNLFFTDEILDTILRYTNMFISNNGQKQCSVANSTNGIIDRQELVAYFGLLYVRGAYGFTKKSLHYLWSEEYGHGIFRATMSLNR